MVFHFVDSENIGGVKGLHKIIVPHKDMCFVASNEKKVHEFCQTRLNYQVLGGYEVYANAADFMLIAKLGEALFQLRQAKTKATVVLYTEDKCLIRTFTHLCEINDIRFVSVAGAKTYKQRKQLLSPKEQVLAAFRCRPMTFKQLSQFVSIDEKSLLRVFNQMVSANEVSKESKGQWTLSA